MKRFVIFLLVITFASCDNTISEEHLPYLNGYWEITAVEFQSGKKKEYNISTTVDYIKLDGLSGFRKKVNPKFNGSFETSDDAESFLIVKEGNVFNMLYKNNLSEWNETIVSLSKNTFSVQNAEGKTYNYKRFEPINLTK